MADVWYIQPDGDYILNLKCSCVYSCQAITFVLDPPFETRHKLKVFLSFNLQCHEGDVLSFRLVRVPEYISSVPR